MTSNKLTNALNNVLATTLDLKLRTKQAHWNVKGSNFYSLHELFDKFAAEHDQVSDDIAERVVQLGSIALGTYEQISKNSGLKKYDAKLQKQEDVLKALHSSVSDAAKITKDAIEVAENSDDPVTADLLTEVTAILEKQKWFLSAHIK